VIFDAGLVEIFKSVMYYFLSLPNPMLFWIC